MNQIRSAFFSPPKNVMLTSKEGWQSRPREVHRGYSSWPCNSVLENGMMSSDKL